MTKPKPRPRPAPLQPAQVVRLILAEVALLGYASAADLARRLSMLPGQVATALANLVDQRTIAHVGSCYALRQ
jgi:hypothetical protein